MGARAKQPTFVPLLAVLPNSAIADAHQSVVDQNGAGSGNVMLRGVPDAGLKQLRTPGAVDAALHVVPVDLVQRGTLASQTVVADSAA